MVRSAAALRLPLRNRAGPGHREHGALRVRQYGGPSDRGVEGRNHDLAAGPRRIVGGLIYVAGDAPQRDLALTHIEGVGLPAEHRVVERSGAPRVVGAELADGPGARLVDELGTPVLTRLPDPEYRPRWIRDDR